MIIAEHELPNDRRMIQQTKRSILIFESCISGGTNQRAADGRGKGGRQRREIEYKSAIKIQKQFKIHIKTKLKFTDPISSRCSGKTKNP